MISIKIIIFVSNLKLNSTIKLRSEKENEKTLCWCYYWPLTCNQFELMLLNHKLSLLLLWAIRTCNASLFIISLIILNRFSESDSAKWRRDVQLFNLFVYHVQSRVEGKPKVNEGLVIFEFSFVSKHFDAVWWNSSQILKSKFELHNKVWVSNLHLDNFVDVELSRNKSEVEVPFRPKIKTKM